MNDRLSLVGLEVFELTPRSVGGGAGNRASEIAEWLDAAEERRLDVANWVVLDDRDVRALDEQRFQNHTVLINPFTGLRFCDLVAALRVFGRDEADLAMLKSPSTGDLQALMDMQLQLGLGGGGAHEPVSPRHSSELIPI